MTTLRVLDLNDWELSLYRGSELEFQAPGFALVEAKSLVFGEQAVAEHRRSPLNAHSAYWHRLDASPVRSRNRDVRTSADLVFNQLKLLIASGSSERQEVVIAVPSHYSKDQLAVLLGIVDEAPIAPLGLVDALVASGSTSPADFVLDVSLHQMTITRLAIAQDMVKRLTVESVPEGGLLPVLDTWLTRIADEFVRETRFDPLRIADTEQQLWSRLYAWLRGEIAARDYGLYLEVSNKSGNWHVNFDVRELQRLIADQTKAAVALCAEVPNARLRVTSRATRIPGIIQGIRDAGITDCETLAPDALIKGIAGNAAMFAKGQEEGIKFVTSLKSFASANQGAESIAFPMEEGPPTVEALKDPPTHLVYAGIAYEVSDPVDLTELIPGFAPTDVYRATQSSRTIDIHRTINDSEALLQSLECGDSLVEGDQVLLAIRLAAHGA